MNEKTFEIIKSSGEREPFSYEKYTRSLKRSGLSESQIDEVLKAIEPSITAGMTTRQLYGKTYAFLRSKMRTCASRYSLKNALRLLGPSGFPFEKLVAALLKHEGFEVSNDISLQGKCVSHEIDVIAKKPNELYFVECKFHNLVGTKSNIKTSLYVKARLEDLKYVQKDLTGGILATNTQFTTDAIQYGECAGITMLAWAYPRERGIERLIEQYQLYPITVLVNLKSRERAILLNAGIVTCQELSADNPALRGLPISSQTLDILRDEYAALCR